MIKWFRKLFEGKSEVLENSVLKNINEDGGCFNEELKNVINGESIEFEINSFPLYFSLCLGENGDNSAFGPDNHDLIFFLRKKDKWYSVKYSKGYFCEDWPYDNIVCVDDSDGYMNLCCADDFIVIKDLSIVDEAMLLVLDYDRISHDMKPEFRSSDTRIEIRTSNSIANSIIYPKVKKTEKQNVWRAGIIEVIGDRMYHFKETNDYVSLDFLAQLINKSS